MALTDARPLAPPAPLSPGLHRGPRGQLLIPDAADRAEAADAGASTDDAEPPDVGLVVAADAAARHGGVGRRDAAVDPGPADSGLHDSGAPAADGGQIEPDSGLTPIDPLTEGPVLFFSDLITAPRSGNSDDSRGQRAGVDGALVTVWGKGLGAAQADSTITVGGVPARVYYWGPANHGADLVTRMGMSAIELQIPGALASSATASTSRGTGSRTAWRETGRSLGTTSTTAAPTARSTSTTRGRWDWGSRTLSFPMEVYLEPSLAAQTTAELSRQLSETLPATRGDLRRAVGETGR